VIEVDTERALVLEPVAGMVTWSFALVPLDASTTRLVTRVRLRQERTLANRLTLLALDPAALVMTRKMLLGVRRRAESLARTPSPGGALRRLRHPSRRRLPQLTGPGVVAILAIGSDSVARGRSGS
jgi:hypothetical protein